MHGRWPTGSGRSHRDPAQEDAGTRRILLHDVNRIRQHPTEAPDVVVVDTRNALKGKTDPKIFRL